MPVNEIIQSWFVKAAHDLETAKIVASHLPDYDDVIAFHCQQAIEKSLKGYLVYLDLEFKPVHDLGYLLNLTTTKDDSFDVYFEDLDKILPFYILPSALSHGHTSPQKHSPWMPDIKILKN
ncbi:MAG: HEPN domain-containing protein [Bacteroidales bacterium]|nr:HEPN domain-containing protein [Bacteroidales bacterium]